MSSLNSMERFRGSVRVKVRVALLLSSLCAMPYEVGRIRAFLTVSAV